MLLKYFFAFLVASEFVMLRIIFMNNYMKNELLPSSYHYINVV